MLRSLAVSRQLLRDVAGYLAVVLVLGTAGNFVPGRRLAWWGHGNEPPRAGVDFSFIDPGSADTLRTNLPRVVVLDTRSGPERAAGTIPGAEAIAYTELDRQLSAARLARLQQADAVVIYGAGQESDVEQLLAQELHRRGLRSSYVLLGGFAAWQAAALPVAGGAT